MKEFFNRLQNDFKDKEYAHSYMESHSVSRLAAQVFALRKQRKLSQEELAALTGIAQETISKIESGNFSSLTMKTLQKLSRAFDVNVLIAFEPFSSGILDVANLTREKLEVESRNKDLASSFTDHTIFVRSSADGKWKAINHLRVSGGTPPLQPLKPNNEWQSLGAPMHQEKVAA